MNQTKTTVTPVKASTQSFLEIEDIKDGIVILRDGSCVLIIATTAINFGLLSEKEQDAAIYAYGALLNSLTFPIQILIRSKRKDITSYLRLLEEQERRTLKEALKAQIRRYREFIESTVQVNNVLEKSFFTVIPMSFLEIGIGKTLGSKLAKKTADLPYPKDYIMEKAKNNLYPKRDHLFRLFNRLGLKSRQLSTQELVKFFFGIYNPEVEGQILSTPEDYQTPLVKPAANFLENNFSPINPEENFKPPSDNQEVLLNQPPISAEEEKKENSPEPIPAIPTAAVANQNPATINQEDQSLESPIYDSSNQEPSKSI